jgi:hypothetical protein
MNKRFWTIIGSLVVAGCLTLPAGAQQSGGTSQGSTAQGTTTQTEATKKSAATPGVTKGQINQQRRIRQGVRSGELTRPETKKREAEQAKIQADKKAAKSDGTVTKDERKQLHKEENKASKDIYKQKHDAQKRPRTKKSR